MDNNSSDEPRPTLHDQYKEIKRIQKEEEIQYLISMKWFKAYHKLCKSEKGYESTGSEVPEIDNSPLLDESSELKQDLDDSTDYVSVNKQAWQTLKNWYGGGPEIKVQIIKTDKGTEILRDPFPVQSIYRNSETSKTIQTSNKELVSSLAHRMLLLWDVPPDRKYRVFDYHNRQVVAVMNPDKINGDYNILKDQYILFDTKDENGEWGCPELYKQCKEQSTNSSNYNFSNHYNYNYNSYYNSSYHRAEAPGLVGLSNLGNTCFFNSGVQCLIHSIPLMELFLHQDWKKDINKENPIGTKGKLVKAFAQLMKDVWSGEHSYISPYELKNIIGEFAPQFSGYQQQDSHELITFMLDGLHEDLNRCKEKPYVENVTGDGTNDDEISQKSWENFKKRNDSAIVDTFYGQYKSKLNCPECKKDTVIFESYISLSIPISKRTKVKKNIVFFPFEIQLPVRQFSLNLPLNPTFDLFSKEISKVIGRDVNVVVCTMGGYQNFMWYTNDENQTSHSIYYAFEVPDQYKDKFLIVTTIQALQKESYNYTYEKNTAGPFLIPVSSSDASKEEIAEAAQNALKSIWEPCNNPLSDEAKAIAGKIVVPEDKTDSNSRNENQASSISFDNSDSGSPNIFDQEQIQTKINSLDPDNDNSNPSEHEITDEEKNQMKELNHQSSDDDQHENSDEIRNQHTNYFKADQHTRNDSNNNNNLEKEDPYRFEVVIPINTGYYQYSYGGHYTYITPEQGSSGLAIDATYKNLAAKIVNLKIKPQYYKFDTGFSIDSLLMRPYTNYIFPNYQYEEKKKVDIYKCLKYFSIEDKLDEQNKWYCPHCKKFVCATKKMDIWSVPKCLIIQFKRFVSMHEKDERDVSFPEEIDLSDYVIGPQNQEDLKFKLYGVSEHSGVLCGGHYTAHVNVVQDGHVHGSWYYFNDSNVSKSSYESSQNPEAYVLFYRRYHPDEESDVHNSSNSSQSSSYQSDDDNNHYNNIVIQDSIESDQDTSSSTTDSSYDSSDSEAANNDISNNNYTITTNYDPPKQNL